MFSFVLSSIFINNSKDKIEISQNLFYFIYFCLAIDVFMFLLTISSISLRRKITYIELLILLVSILGITQIAILISNNTKKIPNEVYNISVFLIQIYLVFFVAIKEKLFKSKLFEKLTEFIEF